MQVSAVPIHPDKFGAAMGWLNGIGAAAAAVLVAVAFGEGLARVAFGFAVPDLTIPSGMWVTAYASLLFADSLAHNRAHRATRLDAVLAGGAPLAAFSIRLFADGIGAAVFGYIAFLAAVSAWRVWDGSRLGDGGVSAPPDDWLFLIVSAGAVLTALRFLMRVRSDLSGLKAVRRPAAAARPYLEAGAVFVITGLMVWLGALLLATDFARTGQTALLLGAALVLLLMVGVHAAVALMLFFPVIAGAVPEPAIVRIYLLGSEATIVPIMVVMGLLVVAAGIDRDLRDLVHELLRRVRTGQGLAALWTDAGTASLTTLTTANDVRPPGTAIQAMVGAGLWPRSAVGIAAAGAALGSVLPPSLLLALYAMESHVGAFLYAAIAGVGLLVACSLVVALAPLRHRESPLAADPPADQIAARLVRVGIVPAVVLAALFSDRFTLSEAASCGAFAALAVGLGTGRLRPKALRPILIETGRVSAPILFLLIAGGVFAWLVTASGLPQAGVALFKQTNLALAGAGMLAAALLLRWIGIGAVTSLMVLFPLWLPLMTVSAGWVAPDLFGVVLLLVVQAVALFVPSDEYVSAVRAALGDEKLTRRQIAAACRPYAIIFIAAAVLLIALSNALWGLI